MVYLSKTSVFNVVHIDYSRWDVVNKAYITELVYSQTWNGSTDTINVNITMRVYLLCMTELSVWRQLYVFFY